MKYFKNKKGRIKRTTSLVEIIFKIGILTAIFLALGGGVLTGLTFSSIPTAVWVIAIMIFILWITKKKK